MTKSDLLQRRQLMILSGSVEENSPLDRLKALEKLVSLKVFVHLPELML